ncbi:MAG TPA: tetratricopeptide repeat protein [Blastocatellia bacterium]|nr:tetratricopeptide repeat protein [Blastocatellia bacterium]
MYPATCLFAVLALTHPLLPGPLAQNRNAIYGRVATTDDKPIESVRVTLLNDRLAQVGVDYTDVSGLYRFESLPRGLYSILVEPSADYERKSAQVDVNAFAPPGRGGSETFRVDFVLKRLMKREPGKGESIVYHQQVPEAARKEFRRGADALKKKGDFQAASRSLERALQIFPDYYEALEMLGVEYARRSDYQAALPFLRRAVEVNRSAWLSQFALGITLLELKQHKEAVAPLRRAVELNPESEHSMMRLGIALAQDEATREEAIETLNRAIELGKDRVPEAYLHLAFLHNLNRRYREAAEVLETFLRIAPPSFLTSEQREYYIKMLEQFRQKAAAAADKN